MSPAESILPGSQNIPGLSEWMAQWDPAEGFKIFAGHENHLPAISSDARCSIIFEGILQNRSELIDQLGSSAANDADVILAAFSRWHKHLVDKLRGAFLLAIYDKNENALLLIRDHCGVYPAFYAKDGSQIVFSTSIADIVRHPKVGAALNRSAFVDYLCHRRPVPEETFYAQIKRVLPGHFVRFANGGDQTHRYWYSTPPDGIQDYITDANATGFDEMLEKAVLRCTQLGPPGILLSGGLDSVSVACVTTTLCKRAETSLPIAFSVGFPHPDFNEVEKQTSVAKQLGLKQNLKYVNEIVADGGLLELAWETSKTWSQPMLSTWQPLFVNVAANAKELGCKVILTGAGGDEWLNVGSILMADLIRLMDFRGLNRTAKIFLRSYRIRRTALLKHLFWKAGVRLILADHARSIARFAAPNQLRNVIRKRLSKSTLHWVAADPQLKADADHRVEILVEEYMNRVLPKDKYRFYSASASDHFINTITSLEMEQSYEASRRIGIPILHPYFDPDLINLAVRISPEVLQQGGMEKGIIRNSVAKRFPELQFDKQKKASAMNYWLSLITTEGRELYYRNGGPATLIEMGIINGKEIGAVMDQAFASTNPFDNAKIWDLLCLETWSRSHRN